MNTNSNYPEQVPPEYRHGYQPQPSASLQPYPPQSVHPMPGQYPQQPAPGLAYPQQMQYPQGGMYPQQQMPINLVVSNVNNNTASAVAGVGYMGMVRRHPPMPIRLIYFFCIGLYLGSFWAGIALCACCTVVGIPLGMKMLKQVPMLMLL